MGALKLAKAMNRALPLVAPARRVLRLVPACLEGSPLLRPAASAGVCRATLIPERARLDEACSSA